MFSTEVLGVMFSILHREKGHALQTLFPKPIQGRHTKARLCIACFLFQIERNGNIVHFVNALDEKTSNWMRYMNSATCKAEQNVTAFQFKQEIYYRTIKPIPAGEELRVFCGVDYNKKCGLDPSTEPLSDLAQKPHHNVQRMSCALFPSSQTFFLSARHELAPCEAHLMQSP